MCGILFLAQRNLQVQAEQVKSALMLQHWRGPDATALLSLANGHVHLGHNRLAIIDPITRANQPMYSADGRYVIVFNGEIYNYRQLQIRHALPCQTASDTEVLLEGYARLGEAFFSELEGMYAFVIYDNVTQTWVAARDPLGIKPLYMCSTSWGTCIASEPRVVATLTNAAIDTDSLQEWRLIRRPAIGHSFFAQVKEVLPGSLIRHDGTHQRFWQPQPGNDRFDQHEFETLLREVVREHEISDVTNVALLSGGIDSALITALSNVQRTYTVGLDHHNEIEAAASTATHLGRQIVSVTLSATALQQRWRDLTRLRGEPLSLPNEGLIHAVCERMQPHEKVVLTGEGADELMFGYDRIYRWAAQNTNQNRRLNIDDFLSQYGYTPLPPTRRLQDQLEELSEGRHPIEAVEDIFYQLHLPCLLRRMDFAAMAASKEARVPFADRRLVSYCYRLPAQIKLNDHHAKIPLRTHLEHLGVTAPLRRPKIGFSAQAHAGMNRYDEYRKFQNIVLETLSWS